MKTRPALSPPLSSRPRPPAQRYQREVEGRKREARGGEGGGETGGGVERLLIVPHKISILSNQSGRDITQISNSHLPLLLDLQYISKISR